MVSGVLMAAVQQGLPRSLVERPRSHPHQKSDFPGPPQERRAKLPQCTVLRRWKLTRGGSLRTRISPKTHPKQDEMVLAPRVGLHRLPECTR